MRTLFVLHAIRGSSCKVGCHNHFYDTANEAQNKVSVLFLLSWNTFNTLFTASRELEVATWP